MAMKNPIGTCGPDKLFSMGRFQGRKQKLRSVQERKVGKTGKIK
jgi:hypothetical protein